jgi:hypothetical protein
MNYLNDIIMSYEIIRLDKTIKDPIVVVDSLEKARAKLCLMSEPAYVIDLKTKKRVIWNYYVSKKKTDDGKVLLNIVVPKNNSHEICDKKAVYRPKKN